MSQRQVRTPIADRLRQTGTVLDSLVEARKARLPELYERYGHLEAATMERSQRSFEAALRTRTLGEDGQLHPRAGGPALIMECKAASPRPMRPWPPPSAY